MTHPLHRRSTVASTAEPAPESRTEEAAMAEAAIAEGPALNAALDRG